MLSKKVADRHTSRLFLRTLHPCALGLVIVLLSSDAVVEAQLLDYGTLAGYGIGKGTMGNDYTTPLASCITGTTSQLSASQSNIRANISYNSDDYDEAFHVDQNAKASVLGIGEVAMTSNSERRQGAQEVLSISFWRPTANETPTQSTT
jgi:hypothetical protein